MKAIKTNPRRAHLWQPSWSPWRSSWCSHSLLVFKFAFKMKVVGLFENVDKFQTSLIMCLRCQNICQSVLKSLTFFLKLTSWLGEMEKTSIILLKPVLDRFKCKFCGSLQQVCCQIWYWWRGYNLCFFKSSQHYC